MFLKHNSPATGRMTGKGQAGWRESRQQAVLRVPVGQWRSGKAAWMVLRLPEEAGFRGLGLTGTVA